jgi:PAS domain S-box-containing protein
VFEQEVEFARLERLPGAVRWAMAVTGEVTAISPEIAQVRGVAPEAAMAQGVDEIHPPESLRKSLEYFEYFSRELLEGRLPEPFSGALEYFHADGSTVWCDVMTIPITDDAGTIIELRGVSVPRTERS